MPAAQLAIRYRDFWDVPRIFVVAYDDKTYLFDCPFDDELDDFPPDYSVRELDADAVAALGEPDWSGLSARGRLIGDIPVAEVEFDATRRSSVSPSVFTRIRPGKYCAHAPR